MNNVDAAYLLIAIFNTFLLVYILFQKDDGGAVDSITIPRHPDPVVLEPDEDNQTIRNLKRKRPIYKTDKQLWESEREK